MSLTLARYAWWVAIIAIVIGIIYYFTRVQTPQNTVTQFLEALRQGNRELASHYVRYQWRSKFVQSQAVDPMQSVILRVLRTMRYEVGKPERREECVMVPVKLTFTVGNTPQGFQTNIPVVREFLLWRVDLKKWESELSRSLGFENAERFVNLYILGQSTGMAPTGEGGVISPWGPGGGVVTPGFGGLGP